MPNNLYIENTMYENDDYLGVAEFYIKDNNEYIYIYQENKNQEKIETYIDTKNNTSTSILHTEKTITQNKIEENIDFELPLKNNLLDKLNNQVEYNYTFKGKEKINEINCLKISLTNKEDNYDYYIDENTGYIVQYESENSKNKETYKYNINSVTDEQMKKVTLDNYEDYLKFNLN